MLRSVRERRAHPPHSAGFEVLTDCYCVNGHRLTSPGETFRGHDGISILLKNDRREGLLSLSPIIGDRSRRFFFSDRLDGEIFTLCCPTCQEPFPIYNICSCGAYLAALFKAPGGDMANCIGICQRIGCFNAEIMSSRGLRLFNREEAF